MEGTTRTILPNWQACQLACQSQPKCETWGFWPDHGCHLQGSGAKLTEVRCPEEEKECAGLGVLSGPRDFADSWGQNLIMQAPASVAAGGGAGAKVGQNSSESVLNDATA